MACPRVGAVGEGLPVWGVGESGVHGFGFTVQADAETTGQKRRLRRKESAAATGMTMATSGWAVKRWRWLGVAPERARLLLIGGQALTIWRRREQGELRRVPFAQ